MPDLSPRRAGSVQGIVCETKNISASRILYLDMQKESIIHHRYVLWRHLSLLVNPCLNVTLTKYFCKRNPVSVNDFEYEKGKPFQCL